MTERDDSGCPHCGEVVLPAAPACTLCGWKLLWRPGNTPSPDLVGATSLTHAVPCDGWIHPGLREALLGDDEAFYGAFAFWLTPDGELGTLMPSAFRDKHPGEPRLVAAFCELQRLSAERALEAAGVVRYSQGTRRAEADLESHVIYYQTRSGDSYFISHAVSCTAEAVRHGPYSAGPNNPWPGIFERPG